MNGLQVSGCSMLCSMSWVGYSRFVAKNPKTSPVLSGLATAACLSLVPVIQDLVEKVLIMSRKPVLQGGRALINKAFWLIGRNSQGDGQTMDPSVGYGFVIFKWALIADLYRRCLDRFIKKPLIEHALSDHQRYVKHLNEYTAIKIYNCFWWIAAVNNISGCFADCISIKNRRLH